MNLHSKAVILLHQFVHQLRWQPPHSRQHKAAMLSHHMNQHHSRCQLRGLPLRQQHNRMLLLPSASSCQCLITAPAVDMASGSSVLYCPFCGPCMLKAAQSSVSGLPSCCCTAQARSRSSAACRRLLMSQNCTLVQRRFPVGHHHYPLIFSPLACCSLSC